MGRDLLNKEINAVLPIKDSEWGNPKRSPSGTRDDKVTISWQNQLFAKRSDAIKRVYTVINKFDGTPRDAKFEIKISNIGSNKYAFFNKFIIARLYYETASGQDTGCTAGAGMNCIKWEDGKFEKRVNLPNDIKSQFSAMWSGKIPDIKDIDLFKIIPSKALQEAYNIVESQVLSPKASTSGGFYNGKVYLEIVLYWQEYKKGKVYSGTFSNFQSKPINMVFFPVKPTYFFFPGNKVIIDGRLKKRIEEFRNTFKKQIGFGVSTKTKVTLQIGTLTKSESTTGSEKSVTISSEIKSTLKASLNAEITIPIIKFIKWEGSVEKSTEETEGTVNTYTTNETLMNGIESSLQQTTDYLPTKRGKTRRFFLVPVVEVLYVKSVIYSPVNRFGFAIERIARPEEEIYLKIVGWDIEEKIYK